MQQQYPHNPPLLAVPPPRPPRKPKFQWCNSVRTKDCPFWETQMGCRFLHVDQFARLSAKSRQCSGVLGMMDKHAKTAKISYIGEVQKASCEADREFGFPEVCSLFAESGFHINQQKLATDGFETMAKNLIRLVIHTLHLDLPGAPEQMFKALVRLEDALSRDTDSDTDPDTPRSSTTHRRTCSVDGRCSTASDDLRCPRPQRSHSADAARETGLELAPLENLVSGKAKPSPPLPCEVDPSDDAFDPPLFCNRYKLPLTQTMHTAIRNQRLKQQSMDDLEVFNLAVN
ncbi:hypothetical protein DIPPA_15821 [Diplonema papillatum]|nr:hypothetical protein DIPPA_15821 [Diplonema papillatum]|eukprot:gene8720-13501_t